MIDTLDDRKIRRRHRHQEARPARRNFPRRFVNLENLINVYTAANAGITISGYSIGANVSATAGNLLSIANDGLLVGHDDSKVDKVTTATVGNIVVFGASGAIVDSGGDVFFRGR